MELLQEFTDAIRARNMVRIVFRLRDGEPLLDRIFAPLDFGKSRKAFDRVDRFWLWDEGASDRRPLGLLLRQIEAMEVLDDHFDPSQFVTWDVKSSPWRISRDWGQFS